MLLLISTGKQTLHDFENTTSSQHFGLSLHFEITHLFVPKGHCSAVFFHEENVVVYNIRRDHSSSVKVFQATLLVTVLFIPSFLKDLLCYGRHETISDGKISSI